MSLQRISEFAENQEGNAIFITYTDRCLVWLTSGSFRLDRPYEQHRFE